MRSWFHTPERIEALSVSARSWIGTPFFRDSCSKGHGVCCSRLVAAIYRECGFCDIEIPSGSVSHARFARESLVVPFVQSLDQFYEVTPEVKLPGDLIGIQIGRVVHHLGIVTLGTHFVHALDKVGVTISSTDDATWASRIRYVWRPMP